MTLRASARPTEREASLAWALPFLLLVAFAVRLAFVGNEGFKTDVGTFEAWASALVNRGFATFYGTIGFADYPPGYFYILAVVGKVVQVTAAGGYGLLLLVKLPAILADLGVGALLYALVRRFAPNGVAIGAAAFYLLNPAVIYNSALWGQVDSISGGLALLAIYALLRSDDDTSTGSVNWWIVGAWLAFAYSLLIKPQAAVLLPLMIAFAFVDDARRRRRLLSTGIGIVAALLLALLLTEPFHASNPIAAFAWLLNQYASGSSVYAYNSVNAFNLWALRGSLWQPDSTYILVMPQYVWGVLLVAAAVALTVWRYCQERSSRSLLEGCAIATIAFFILATRMHERYLFNGVLFTIACIPFARRYLWGAVALSAVLFANLVYSLQYLAVVSNQIPGMNSQNLWGPGTQALAGLAVATFFYLGYAYLGATPAPSEEAVAGAPAAGDEKVRAGSDSGAPAFELPASRSWFDPREGLAALRWPLDYAIMAALGVANFVLSFVGYWWPPDKVFDEIYFARAGEEYLQNLRIYENTHPPFSKLLITLSIVLFG
ncbi:MAG: hypothetical protein JO263_03550, partial [Candidatus Eremiobacteraeota bacterium]|nr:hypothetical protein [Candidatus Eremiobacteraeota bacterium]